MITRAIVANSKIESTPPKAKSKKDMPKNNTRANKGNAIHTTHIEPIIRSKLNILIIRYEINGFISYN